MQPAWESLAGPGLACVRVAGLATFAPMLAGGALPVRVRIAVAAVMYGPLIGIDSNEATVQNLALWRHIVGLLVEHPPA